MNSYSHTTKHVAGTQNELVDILRLVADPTRLQVLCTLQEQGAHCVSDCSCHVPDVSQSLLSHHIADLREAGLVQGDKQGLRVYYSLTARGQRVMTAINNLKEEYPMNGCKCANCTCQNCTC